MHKYYASRKRARLRWRHSDKGRAWDKAYYQRDEVKKRRHEWYKNKIINCIIKLFTNEDFIINSMI